MVFLLPLTEAALESLRRRFFLSTVYIQGKNPFQPHTHSISHLLCLVWSGGILQSVNKIIKNPSPLWGEETRVTEKTTLCFWGSAEGEKTAATWDSHSILKLIEISSVCLGQRDEKETNNCGGRREDERSLKKCFRWWSVVLFSSLSCSSGPCRQLTAGLCWSESCRCRVILRISQGQPCSVAPQGVFQRSHRMNMSLKVYGSPTREELRDTQVSVTSGMCHCKRPSGLPALCPALCFYHCVRLPPSQSCSPISFSDAKTPDAVLQTTPKQVQKVTMKQEVNFFQNKLPWHFRCSLIPSPMTLPPTGDNTSLGDTFSSTFRLPGACLAGCSARVGCCGHMYLHCQEP